MEQMLNVKCYTHERQTLVSFAYRPNGPVQSSLWMSVIAKHSHTVHLFYTREHAF